MGGCPRGWGESGNTGEEHQGWLLLSLEMGSSPVGTQCSHLPRVTQSKLYSLFLKVENSEVVKSMRHTAWVRTLPPPLAEQASWTVGGLMHLSDRGDTSIVSRRRCEK